jgi:hypothetical protein
VCAMSNAMVEGEERAASESASIVGTTTSPNSCGVNFVDERTEDMRDKK